jgi:hypothetical protein
VEVFWERVAKTPKRDDVPPIITTVRSPAAADTPRPSRSLKLQQERSRNLITARYPIPAHPPRLLQAKYYMVNIYRGGMYVLAVLAGEVRRLGRPLRPVCAWCGGRLARIVHCVAAI